jgi:glycosyltransferase involved in cell wall biosynthesis
MKILLLTTHINVGGIGMYILTLAKYLKKEGYDVVIVSSSGELRDEFVREGIKHIYVDIKTKFEFGLKIWKALPRLIKILREHEIQLIHAQTRVAQVISFCLQKITGTPFISTCHGFFNYKRMSRRFFPCWGEKIIAISKSVKKHLIDDFKLNPDRVVQIYNGIELDQLLKIGKEKDYMFLEQIGFFSDDIIIGSIGRLSPVKGFKYLVKGFKLIAEEYPRAKLLIIGEGTEEDTLREMVDDSGLNTRVIFIAGGGMSEKYLPLFDIFCMPSLHEGLGLSMMEAMAAGKVCIASDVGGLSELISDEYNGLLFPPKDPARIAGTIRKVLSNPLLCERLSANAREKARNNFSIDDSIKKTVNVYKKVMEKSGK